MILDRGTQQTFNFHTFHSTTLHLCIKIFHQKKNGKGHILTLMSDTLSFIKDEIAPLWINDVYDGCLAMGERSTENISEFQVGITAHYQATIINFTSFIHRWIQRHSIIHIQLITLI